jgi:hypothetical protein
MKKLNDFPNAYAGFAQSAFFGGKADANIRKAICPVIYVDFLSMYPTINCLMALWRFVIAGAINVIEHCNDTVQAFLRDLTYEALFDPATWPRMTGFVKIIPNGDILPIRSKYSPVTNDWQIGLNHLYAKAEDALWYPIPDVVFSILKTATIPEIVDAFLIEPGTILPKLCSTKLRRTIEIDPTRDDFFRVLIEERLRLSSRSDLSAVEIKRLGKTLKVLANATSYGIYAQMDRQESNVRVEITCHGIDPEPFTCKVTNPDLPGEFCFPPLGSLITSGARLMLGLLEHCVSELGGTYVMEDTDSMAIVAMEHGGLVPCRGGPIKLNDGRMAVKALSWQELNGIAEWFRSLNPYGDKARSILKIEGDNYDPVTGKQRQIYCFAVSAKRYALFLFDEDGNPVLLQKEINNHEDRWSEHGLGHLRNPIDLGSEDRDWIREAWLSIIRLSLNLPTEPMGFEHLPAVGRVTITSPKVMRALAKLNIGKKHSARLKPFNFLLSCHVKQFGHPPGVDPEKFHLVAPYELNADRWAKMEWIDQYTGQTYRIRTDGFHGSRGVVRVKTYGDVLREYAFHPGSKSADAQGKPSGRQTIGLLRRRHIRVDQIIYVGKESNKLEEIESGLVHSPQSVYTEYPDPRREEWETKILPALRKFPIRVLARFSNKSPSMLRRTLAGRSRPRRRNQVLLVSVLRKIGVI